MVVHRNCPFFQFVCQTVDFYRRSVLRSSQGSVDPLSCTTTAKRSPEFNGSSAGPFHRKLRAETLSTVPILHPTVSPHRAVEEVKRILPCLHPQNTNLAALKRGTSDGIMTGKHKERTVPCEMKHGLFLSCSFASCQTGQTSPLLQLKMKRWRIESSPYPSLKAGRNVRVFACCVCISHVAA